MNVVSIRKSLRAGEWPSETEDQISLKDNQIHHLEATVPCVRMVSSTGNATFYFPDSGASLTTWFTHGISLHSEYRGTLLKGANDQVPCHEDGTARYVTAPGSAKPAVFSDYHRAVRAAEHSTAILWKARNPYKAIVEGYESVHDKRWPKDTRFGGDRDKISLHVLDGDFVSYYLSIEPISHPRSMDWAGHALTEAVRNGEYDGSEAPGEFADRVHERWAERQRRIDRRLDFKNFVRHDPKGSVKKAVDDHNQQIDAAKAFLKMATRLRRHMKANPGWYKRAKTPGDGNRNSELFRYTDELKESDRARRESDPDLDRAVSRLEG